jgi:exonuclease III
MLFCSICCCLYCFPMDEPCSDYSILSWNVRGLHNRAKQEEVRQVIQSCRPMFVCLQETKLDTFSSSTVTSCLGAEFPLNFWYLLADGTHGGVLLSCRDVGYSLLNAIIKAYIVMVMISCRNTPVPWCLTGVYGPQADFDKHLFITKLQELK